KLKYFNLIIFGDGGVDSIKVLVAFWLFSIPALMPPSLPAEA
ncbi:unnamed protein product, partial [marine sediment metagenome]